MNCSYLKNQILEEKFESLSKSDKVKYILIFHSNFISSKSWGTIQKIFHLKNVKVSHGVFPFRIFKNLQLRDQRSRIPGIPEGDMDMDMGYIQDPTSAWLRGRSHAKPPIPNLRGSFLFFFCSKKKDIEDIFSILCMRSMPDLGKGFPIFMNVGMLVRNAGPSVLSFVETQKSKLIESPSYPPFFFYSFYDIQAFIPLQSTVSALPMMQSSFPLHSFLSILSHIKINIINSLERNSDFVGFRKIIDRLDNPGEAMHKPWLRPRYQKFSNLLHLKQITFLNILNTVQLCSISAKPNS
jgi:hypothetical protein